MKKKKIFQLTFSILFSTLLVIGLVYAWTAPTQNPPAGNVEAPINVSDTAQSKIGNFGLGGGAGQPLYWLKNIGGTLYFSSTNPSGDRVVIGQDGKVGIGIIGPAEKLEVNGAIKIGTTSNTNAGTIRWTGTDFEGYTGSEWKSLTSGGGGSSGGGVYGINVETLSANKTLTPGVDAMYQYLDPNGTHRVITLATSTAKAGDRFIIRHNGTYDDTHYLSVRQGASTFPLDFIYAGAIKEFIFDGTNWISAENGTGEDNDKKYNVTIGSKAMGSNYGAAVGYSASGSSYGAAVGCQTNGNFYGTAVGYYANGCCSGTAVGSNNLSTFYGTAVGNNALGYNYGTAVGYYAKGMRYGAALGYEAGYNINTGEDRYNTLVGAYSGYQITTGKGNIILGYKSGYDSTYSPTTGSYNILIGNQSWTPTHTTSNFLNIGGLIFGTDLATTTNTISTGGVGIGTTDPGSYRLYVNGTAYSTGGWQSSDERLKNIISGIESPVERLEKLKGVKFEWKTDEYPEKGLPEGTHYGLIAQEVEKVFPEVVGEDNEGYKTLSYNELIPVLIEAIKEQEKTIKEQEKRIEMLETKLNIR